MADNNGATPKDIFISYGRQQNADEFVDKVSAEIEKAGWSTFVDRTDITAGDSIMNEVASGIMNCKAVVVVITAKYLDSKWCQTELINAYVRKKIIFPIILGDRIPEEEMKKTEYGSSVSTIIAEYLYTHFKTARYEQGPMEQLLRGISKKLGQKKDGEEEVDAGIPALHFTDQCTSSHFRKIAARITSWESIAIEFGIEAAQVITIRKLHPGDYEAQKQTMLQEWKGKQKGDASYQKLMKIFTDLENLQMVHYIECLVLGKEE